MTTSLSVKKALRCGCRQALGFDADLVEDLQTGDSERLGIADLGLAVAAHAGATRAAKCEFSNPKQRGSYHSEASAVLTLDELERWLTDYIVCVYHAKRHCGVGTSPLQRWTAGIFGDEHTPGRGAIDRPTDEERIRLSDRAPVDDMATICAVRGLGL